MSTKHNLFKKVLIPFDFSETASSSLQHAINLVKQLEGELVLLHIIESATFPSAIAHAFSGFEKKVEEVSNEKLNELANSIGSEHGIKVSILTQVGKIYKKITETARQAHIDIIVMGTGGGHSSIIGSNTTRVVQESPCPVVSIQHNFSKVGTTKIVLPIDDTSESRQKVPFACEIARIYKATICIAGLLQSSNEDYQRKFRIKIEQVEDYMNEHGVNCEIAYFTGDLAKNTLKACDDFEADMVCIMTEQDAGLAGFLMGTYASKIINSAKIPVMTVRPAEIDPDRITVTF